MISSILLIYFINNHFFEFFLQTIQFELVQESGIISNKCQWLFCHTMEIYQVKHDAAPKGRKWVFLWYTYSHTLRDIFDDRKTSSSQSPANLLLATLVLGCPPVNILHASLIVIVSICLCSLISNFDPICVNVLFSRHETGDILLSVTNSNYLNVIWIKHNSLYTLLLHEINKCSSGMFNTFLFCRICGKTLIFFIILLRFAVLINPSRSAHFRKLN